MSRSSGVLFRGEMFLWTCEIQVDSWCLTPEKYLHLQEKQDADAILKNYKKHKNRVRSRHAHIYTV